MINIQIQKKDTWLLSAILIFLIGVGYVIAIGENYAVHGHDQDEINLPACGANQVLKYSGGVWGCQNDNTGSVSLSGCYWTAWDSNCVDRWGGLDQDDYVAIQSISCGANEVMVGIDIRKIIVDKSEDDERCDTISSGVVPPGGETTEYFASKRYRCCSLS
jgi:hypothetical protein